MNHILKTHYWNDPQAFDAFKKFIYQIHGLDFSEWEATGYWDDAYTPFSYFQGNTVIASVCLYFLKTIIDGKETQLVQISGVGTLPEYRRQGLNRQLTEIGLDWAKGKHDGIFLFSDDEAIPFYQRCGFVPIEEYLEILPINPIPQRLGVFKLNPNQSKELSVIYQYASQRAPISNKFSVLNEKLFMFHVLHSLRNCTYHIPDLECLVCFERSNGLVQLYDIVGKQMPPFMELYPYIADIDDTTIEFHFHTDKLGLTTTQLKPISGNNPFVQKPFPFKAPVFPFTARA